MSAEPPSPEPATSAPTLSRTSAGMSPSRSAPTPDATTAASAGNCSAGGTYVDGSGHSQVFIVSEEKGTWGTAEEVPGSAALNQGGDVEILPVSCSDVPPMRPGRD